MPRELLDMIFATTKVAKLGIGNMCELKKRVSSQQTFF